MSFGEVLKEQRKIADLTQKKLATESGVSRTYLSDVENDRYNPSVKFIEKVTNGLAQKRELSNEEKNHFYNLLMEEAGYGYKPVENTSLIGSDKEFEEMLRRSLNTTNSFDAVEFTTSLADLRVIFNKLCDFAADDNQADRTRFEAEELVKDGFRSFINKITKIGI